MRACLPPRGGEDGREAPREAGPGQGGAHVRACQAGDGSSAPKPRARTARGASVLAAAWLISVMQVWIRRCQLLGGYHKATRNPSGIKGGFSREFVTPLQRSRSVPRLLLLGKTRLGFTPGCGKNPSRGQGRDEPGSTCEAAVRGCGCQCPAGRPDPTCAGRAGCSIPWAAGHEGPNPAHEGLDGWWVLLVHWAWGFGGITMGLLKGNLLAYGELEYGKGASSQPWKTSS